MSRLRDERGGILVLAAVMIPVFLLLAALVVDVGNWYTHKRQLQNRADAAAFAAGVEYAKNWKACVQTGRPHCCKASTAQKIADAARQYAGDPEASDYAGGGLPGDRSRTPRSRTRSKLDVDDQLDNSGTTPTTPTTRTAAAGVRALGEPVLPAHRPTTSRRPGTGRTSR